jgi:hypothetical protein
MDEQPVIHDEFEDGLPAMDPARTLAVLRVLWAVLLIGQVVLVAIAAMIMHSATKQLIDEDSAWQVFAVTSVLMVFNILIGSYLRNQIYKRHWQGDIVKPAGYFFGNIVMFALLESVVLLSIVLCMLRLTFWPWMLPGLVTLMVYLVNFPHGGPMFPTPVQLTKDKAAS